MRGEIFFKNGDFRMFEQFIQQVCDKALQILAVCLKETSNNKVLEQIKQLFDKALIENSYRYFLKFKFELKKYYEPASNKLGISKH